MRAHARMMVLLVSCLISASLASSGTISNSAQGAGGSLQATLGNASIPFVENMGQVQSPGVRYCASTFGGWVFVTGDGRIVHTLLKKGGHGSAGLRCTLGESFPGAADATVSGTDRVETRVSFLKGQDASRWKQGVPAFASVDLGELYPGIALSLKARGRNVEKLFHVGPGADPGQIRCRLSGASAVCVTESGRLQVTTDLGTVEFTRPVAYQDVNGTRSFVDASYVVRDTEYGFQLGPYDHAKSLVIDPLMASTFLGGSNDDYVEGMVLDRDGNAFLVGSTESWDFPATQDSAYPSAPGNRDAFVSKFSPGLTNLLASTFLGGSGSDEGFGIAIDDDGNPYITGSTDSADFPLTGGAMDTSLGPWGAGDAFVVKLDAALTGILAATYLGGVNWEEGRAIRIDTNGNVYVAGRTQSVSFPATPGAYMETYGGFGEWNSYALSALVKLVQGTLTLILCNSDQGQYQINIRADDSIDIGKWDQAAEQWTALAWTGGAGVVVGDWQSVEVSAREGFIEVLLDGTQVLTASDTEAPVLTGGRVAIAAMVNEGGEETAEVYVDNVSVVNGSGTIWSDDFNDGNIDDWNVNQWGSLAPGGWSIYGEFEPGNYCLYSLTALNGTGGGGSWAEPSDPNLAADAFVSKLDSGLTQLLASTFLGGSSDDTANALQLGPGGQVYICGDTSSADFPAATNGFDPSYNGGWIDGFAAGFDPDLSLLIGATLLGGMDEDSARAIAADGSGFVYVGGWTWSQDFPTTSNAYSTAFPNGHIGFVSRLSDDLTAMPSSTFLGEAGDRVLALALSSNGSVYAAGNTWGGMPTTPEAYDRTPNGNRDAFISNLSGDLTNLLASTLLGGVGDDEADAIALDRNGDVYVAGRTELWDFPVTNAYQSTPQGSLDGFVSSLDAELSRPPQPLIQVRPASWNFGYVTIGSSATQVFEVINSGRLALSLGSVTLAGGSGVSHFAITNDQCSGQTVAPLGLQTCLVSVVFAPTNQWGKSAVLRISSDDPETPVMDVPVYGTGRSTNVAEILFMEGIERLSAYNRVPHDTNDLFLARQKFADSLATDPNQYGAALYLLITRLLGLVYDPDVAAMLTSFGVSETGRDLWNWTAPFPDPVPSNAPAMDAVISLATLKLGAIFDDGLAAMSRVPTNWTGSILLSPYELPIDNEVEVDAGDFQIFQCAMSVLQGVFRVLVAHDTHFAIQDAGQLKTTAGSYLAAHPSLGTVTNALSLAASTNSFIRAIDFYLAGASLIRAETDAQADDLVVFDPSGAEAEQQARTVLAQVRGSLAGSKSSPFRVELSQFVDLGYLFSHPFNPRDLLTGDGLQRVLCGAFLAQINQALANLSSADSLFNQRLDPANYPVQSDTEVDYGDVCLAKAWLSGMKSAASALAAYDGAVDFVTLGEMKPLLASDVIIGYPRLLLVTNASPLVTASNALRDAIDFYLAGSAFMQVKPDDPADDLAAIAGNTLLIGGNPALQNESSFRSLLQELRDSLSGPVMVDHVNSHGVHDYQETMHLGRLFVPAYVTRAHLPAFDGQNNAVAGSFPDPTFNGVFPGMTQWHLAQLLDLYRPDTDTNGLPDLWELENFGTIGISPHGDSDGDGADNFDEFVAGSFPRRGNSCLSLANVELKPDRAVIRWQSEPYRTYAVEKSTNLLTGFWTIESQVPATPFQNVYTDWEAPARQQYYRIRLNP